MNEKIRMQISAFVDGELPENEAELLLRRMGQDEQLRELVAEYLAIGRMVRGEVRVPGVDRLRDRVNAELDDRPHAEIADVATGTSHRGLRPLAGFAVAATVAVIAVIGLRQAAVDEADPASTLADQVVDVVEVESYTVPPNEDVLRQYIMSHGLEASEHGAVGINPRLVSLEFSEEFIDDSTDDSEESESQTDAEQPDTNE